MKSFQELLRSFRRSFEAMGTFFSTSYYSYRKDLSCICRDDKTGCIKGYQERTTNVSNQFDGSIVIILE